MPGSSKMVANPIFKIGCGSISGRYSPSAASAKTEPNGTIIENPSYDFAFYDVRKQQFVDGRVAKPHLCEADIARFTQNGLFGLRKPGNYHVVAGIVPVPPGTTWMVNEKGTKYRFIAEINPTALPLEATVHDLEPICDQVVRLLAGRVVVVELSGGLDSSLIIEFLHRAGANLYLIGFSSERYEFRTERYIQHYYLDKVGSGILLDYANNPSFSRMELTPKVPAPASEMHFYSRHETMAEEAAKIGAGLVINGDAGDQMLGFAVTASQSESHLPPGYGYWSLCDLWSNQFVYQPHGVEYVSGFGIPQVASLMYRIRGDAKGDGMKLWARNHMSDLLPRELSDFAYCAFHDGWVCDGLKGSAKVIGEMAAVVSAEYSLTSIHPNAMETSANHYGSLDEKERKHFLSLLAFVQWAFSFRHSDYEDGSRHGR